MPPAERSQRTTEDYELDHHRLFESVVLNAARAIRRLYDTRLKPLGLNLTEAMFIEYVNDYGPIIQTEVGRRLGLSRAAVGLIVDRLEAEGLLTRDEHPSDRRAWQLTLTPRGAALCSRIADADEDLRGGLRDGLTEAQARHFIEMTRKVEQNATALMETLIEPLPGT